MDKNELNITLTKNYMLALDNHNQKLQDLSKLPFVYNSFLSIMFKINSNERNFIPHQTLYAGARQSQWKTTQLIKTTIQWFFQTCYFGDNCYFVEGTPVRILSLKTTILVQGQPISYISHNMHIWLLLLYNKLGILLPWVTFKPSNE